MSRKPNRSEGSSKGKGAVKRKDFLKTLATVPLVLAGVGVTAQAQASASVSAKDAEEFSGYLYDSTRCLGCRACVGNCIKVNNMAPLTGEKRDTDGDTRTSIRMYREAKKNGGKDIFYIKASCNHCLHPSCVSACPVSAMRRDEKHGIVFNDPDRCIGCRYCMIACPYDAIKFEWDKALPKIIKCDFCITTNMKEKGIPACVEACPSGALQFGIRKELLKEAYARIKKNPKRYVNKVYGDKDGGGTTILYLAGTNFGNLGFPKDLGEESPAVASETLQETYKWLVAPLVGFAAISYVVSLNSSRKQEEDKEGHNE